MLTPEFIYLFTLQLYKTYYFYQVQCVTLEILVQKTNNPNLLNINFKTKVL